MTQITYYAYTKYDLLLVTPAEAPERVPTPLEPTSRSPAAVSTP